MRLNRISGETGYRINPQKIPTPIFKILIFYPEISVPFPFSTLDILLKSLNIIGKMKFVPLFLFSTLYSSHSLAMMFPFPLHNLIFPSSFHNLIFLPNRLDKISNRGRGGGKVRITSDFPCVGSVLSLARRITLLQAVSLRSFFKQNMINTDLMSLFFFYNSIISVGVRTERPIDKKISRLKGNYLNVIQSYTYIYSL